MLAYEIAEWQRLVGWLRRRGNTALADAIEDAAPPEAFDGDPRDRAVYLLPQAVEPAVARAMAAMSASRLRPLRRRDRSARRGADHLAA